MEFWVEVWVGERKPWLLLAGAALGGVALGASRSSHAS
jgi:hypothetical protein